MAMLLPEVIFNLKLTQNNLRCLARAVCLWHIIGGSWTADISARQFHYRASLIGAINHTDSKIIF